MRLTDIENDLQAIITYICFKATTLSTRKLVKLVYLTDIYHFQLYGKRITNVPFKRYHYGAWAPDIEQAVEELCENGILKEVEVPTKDGNTASVPKPAVRQTQVNLSDSAIEALDMVIKDFGMTPPSDVVAYTKKTLPFIGTDFNEEIDFSRCDPAVAYAKDKGISVEEAATEDIISNPEFVKALENAVKDLTKGRPLLSHEEVFGK